MKKIRFLFLLVILFLVSFSSFAITNISWEYIRDLPKPKGFDRQVGVAQHLYGKIGDYVIVAGGANFPYKSVLDGGAKERYNDLYIFKENISTLDLIKHSKLPYEIEGGSSISTDDGIYIVGGTSNSKISNEILFIKLNKDKTDVDIEIIGKLPFTYQMGIAKYKDGSIYIVSGKQNGINSNKLYRFDIQTKKTIELAPMPSGTERSQSVGEILNNGREDFLYVVGGGTGVAFSDSYAYSFKNNIWKKISNIAIENNKEISVLGGRSIQINKNEMLVLGGFNKEIWDDANLKLGTLKNQELQDYKNEYFKKDPQDFFWNEEILIYNAIKDKWSTLGKVPFLANCGQGLILMGNRIYSINGEIKPGVRSSKIFRGNIK